DIFVPGAPRQDLFGNDHEGGRDGVARCVFHIRRLTYPTLGVLLWTLLEKAQLSMSGRKCELEAHATNHRSRRLRGSARPIGLLSQGFDELNLAKVEPQPLASPACAACLPPTGTSELPEVMALPAGHGACPLWSPANAGPAARMRTVATV